MIPPRTLQVSDVMREKLRRHPELRYVTDEQLVQLDIDNDGDFDDYDYRVADAVFSGNRGQQTLNGCMEEITDIPENSPLMYQRYRQRATRLPILPYNPVEYRPISASNYGHIIRYKKPEVHVFGLF